MSALYRWTKKHRGKLLLGGAAVGGLVLAGKLLERHIEKVQEEEGKKFVEKSLKKKHFLATKTTADETFRELYRSLVKTICSVFNNDDLKSQLGGPDMTTEKKMEIWKEIKILAFSKQITYIVGSAFLAVLVRVELFMLAGQLYNNCHNLKALFNNNYRENEKSVPSIVQEKYLATCKHFVLQGIRQVAADVAKGVRSSTMSSVSLHQSITLAQMQSHLVSILESVRARPPLATKDSLETPVGAAAATPHTTGGIFHDPGKFLIDPKDDFKLHHNSPQGSNGDLGLDGNDARELLKLLLSDTLDIIDSQEVQELLVTLCRQGLAHTMDKLTDFYSPPDHQDAEFVPPGDIEIPLVKLVPIVSGFVSVSADSDDDDEQDDTWFNHLLTNSDLCTLGANIYESYSADQLAAAAGGQSSGAQETWYNYLSTSISKSFSSLF